MSDAVNPIDFIDAKRIYVPDATDCVVDAFVVEGSSGNRYSLIALLGEDTKLGEEFFVLHREEATDVALPNGGVWKNVDAQRTVVNTVYKSRLSEQYKVFQEFNSASFSCGSETVLVGRRADDFGIEKMHIVVRTDAPRGV
ncbi:hypothetical protein [Sphingomonas sp. CFBP 8760]|uniref:hypothetical protein n=1 Tax=Sphingomonas sp. CFBP 8760 TaxID=2775282 RepID=UPI00177F5E85|nr:hypothetical protein [Sphingomonas sp. CFBP 8760]MBD8548309.1 hypothetical protein [Sphingomonas sp. CFBP 8760]